MGGIDIVASYRRIAKVTHAKGLTGEVVAISASNLPFHVAQGMTLWVVPPDYDLVRETTVSSCAKHGDGWLLALEGVTDRTTAQRLSGRYLLATVEDDEEDAEIIEDSFIGWSVHDEKAGLIGTIVEEKVGAAQTLWVVEGALGEILVPAVDEFITSIEAGTIHVTLPDGLLELNR
jgi:16S rRNA processing protein RimM